MKLMIVITRDTDSDDIVQSLVKKEFRVTRMASSGGFLRRGNSTLLVGVEDNQVDQVIKVIKSACQPADSENQFRATAFVVDMPLYTRV
jgi:uncharacterized protein YaaQ